MGYIWMYIRYCVHQPRPCHSTLVPPSEFREAFDSSSNLFGEGTDSKLLEAVLRHVGDSSALPKTKKAHKLNPKT